MITIFKNAKNKKNGTDLHIDDVLGLIQHGHSKDFIIALRGMEPKEYRAKKLNLASICFSGQFAERFDDKILSHSGFICIDFDHIGDELQAVKDTIAGIEYTYAAFISPSNDGIKVLVRVPPSAASHRDHYRAAMRFYAQATQGLYKPDVKCVNESRICFMSWDPDIYIHKQSTLFTEHLDAEGFKAWLNPKPVKSTSGQKPLRAKVPSISRDWADHVVSVTSNIINDAIQGHVHDALMRASNLMGGYIAAGHIDHNTGREHLRSVITSKQGTNDQEADYQKIDDGITHGMKTAVVLDDNHDFEAEYFQPYDKDQKEIFAEAIIHLKDGIVMADLTMHIQTLAKRLNKNMDDVAAIFTKVYDKHKDMFGYNTWIEIKRVEHFLNKHYEFINNEITKRTHYRLRGTKVWVDLNEHSISRHMQHSGFKYAMDKIKSLLQSDFVSTFNPLKDYFTSLPAWDDKEDHIAKLANFITTDNQEFFVEQFRKALVRCIACGLGTYVNRIVFTLVGETQDTGKSSFIRYLSPMGEKYYTESPIKDNKDTQIQFAENFIYNLDDLDDLSKFELGKLKSVISMSRIKERRSYGVHHEELPRICNFFASTNNKEFLVDEQNTRWLVFQVKSISHDYDNYITKEKQIDIHKVWAQAYWLFNNGFSYNLTADEAGHRDIINKGHEVVSPEREMIMKYFKPVAADDPAGAFMVNTDIHMIVSSAGQGHIKIDTRKIGHAMRSLGFNNGSRCINSHTVRGWHVEALHVNDKAPYEIIKEDGIYQIRPFADGEAPF